MMGKYLTLVLALVGVLVAACTPQAEYDIRGAWEYTMLAENGNTYDEGTITFAGEPHKGSYTQLNIYDIEYEGAYTVKGTAITVAGDESWQGTVTDATHMTGTWDDGETRGTWAAVKAP